MDNPEELATQGTPDFEQHGQLRETRQHRVHRLSTQGHQMKNNIGYTAIKNGQSRETSNTG